MCSARDATWPEGAGLGDLLFWLFTAALVCAIEPCWFYSWSWWGCLVYKGAHLVVLIDCCWSEDTWPWAPHHSLLCKARLVVWLTAASLGWGALWACAAALCQLPPTLVGTSLYVHDSLWGPSLCIHRHVPLLWLIDMEVWAGLPPGQEHNDALLSPFHSRWGCPVGLHSSGWASVPCWAQWI